MSDGVSPILYKIHAWSGSQGQKTKLAGSLHLAYCSCFFRGSGEGLQCGGPGLSTYPFPTPPLNTHCYLISITNSCFLITTSSMLPRFSARVEKVIFFGWVNMNLFKKSTKQMQSDSPHSFSSQSCLPRSILWLKCVLTRKSMFAVTCSEWVPFLLKFLYHNKGKNPDRYERVIHRGRCADSSEWIAFLL